jgi:hypothetical protein
MPRRMRFMFSSLLPAAIFIGVGTVLMALEKFELVSVDPSALILMAKFVFWLSFLSVLLTVYNASGQYYLLRSGIGVNATILEMERSWVTGIFRYRVRYDFDQTTHEKWSNYIDWTVAGNTPKGGQEVTVFLDPKRADRFLIYEACNWEFI